MDAVLVFDAGLFIGVGVKVVDGPEEIFKNSNMIVKVKEPQESEWKMLKEEQILFTYLHLAADPKQAKGLIDAKCHAIAYETITDNKGALPLLAPMSEIAGRLAVFEGAYHLKKTSGGTGSGFVISEDGYIVTNHHVAGGVGENGTVEVVFSDESTATGTLVGSDAGYDLAVVKVNRDGLPSLPLGTSSDVRVGDVAVALGSPLGLQGTVTSGIVSALERPVTAGGQGSTSFINAIQTDAAINPGNSGGPLLNGSGEVIGVNTAIATLGAVGGSAGSIGLGFAIPIDTVQRIVDEIISTGSSSTPVIGVSLDTSFPGPGARVSEVTPGSGADEAGLLDGDVITAIDGDVIAESTELIVSIRSNAPGDSVELTILRDGRTQDVTVTLTAAE